MPFDIPHELKQSIKNKNLIIFTGAGISVKEGLPSWKDILLKVLTEKKEYINKSSSYASALNDDILSALEILDKIEDSKKHIFDVFEKTLTIKNNKSEFIQKLSQLTSKFITTNFDSQIEANAPSLRKITKDSPHNLIKIDSEDSYVLKIHGDVEAIDNCIIFTKQYETLYSDDSLAAFQLKKIFSQNTVLFIGFSFSDPYVARLFDYIADLLEDLGPTHYIVTKDPLNHEHLKDIYINQHSDLDIFVDTLLAGITPHKLTSATSEGHKSKEKVLKTDGSDIPPSIISWVGREKEITALNNNFKVYFITGLGGQGKSALAAYYLEMMTASSNYEIFGWRDFKEEDHKFQNKIVSLIMLVKKEHDNQHKYTGLDNETLIDIFFDALGNTPAIFVLDNVDSYIDLEKLEPIDGLKRLYHQAITQNHKSKFIFTCRPFVKLAGLDFFQLPLGGLGDKDVVAYFENSSLPIKSDMISEYALKAYELTKGHPLWISLIVAQGKRGERELNSFLNSISRNDITDDSPSSIMSENILGKIWLSLIERHKVVLRSLAESVQSLTIEDYSEIVSGELSYNKFIKSLRAVKNLGLIIEKTGGEYVELHPLVKEFIRNKFPRNERTKFIHMFIEYYGKVVLILKPRLSSKLGFNDFLNWTNQIELYSNAKEYQKALDAMHEIHDAIKAAGHIEEYLRVSAIIFHSIPWNKHKISAFNNFDTVFLDTIKSSTEYGDNSLTSFLLTKYESTVESKDPSYIVISEAKVYHAWFNSEYEKAIEVCEKTAFLLESAKQPENTSLKNEFALALRDSGDPDNMDKALGIFLSGEDISKVTNNLISESMLGGTFYGNIGRCLQFMGRFDEALNCLCKSFILIYDGGSSDRLLNLGYASQWLSEILKKDGKADDACYFYRLALNKWENTSPPLHNRYKQKNRFDSTKHTIQSIFSTEDWRVEKYCNNWVRGIIETEAIPPEANVN